MITALKRNVFNLGCVLLFPACLFLGKNAFAQENVEFKRLGDRKINGIKLVKQLNNISLIQTSVLFQNVTKRSIIRSERNFLGTAGKSGGNSMTAELTAYLVFSDGEPTDEEYQKVTDDFYRYLNTRLAQSEIKNIPWEMFSSSKYFTILKEENENDKNADEMKKKGNAWKIFTANKGPRPIRYNPISHNYNVPAVRGTVRMSNYGKEVNVDALMSLNIIIDFADIYLEGEASSGSAQRTYSTLNWRKSTVKYDIEPNIRITGRHNGGNQIFIFSTSGKTFDEVYNTTDVRTGEKLNASVAQDAEKIQKRSFLSYLPSTAQKHNIDPFVVEVTKSEYFKNVGDALKKYADQLVGALADAKK